MTVKTAGRKLRGKGGWGATQGPTDTKLQGEETAATLAESAQGDPGR